MRPMKKSLKFKKILLVEDSPIVQQVHMDYLKELGYKSDLAQDGEEALNMFKNGYDLILLDIRLPKVNGIEVTKEIRCYEKEKNLKPIIIIALTAFNQTVKEDCEIAGVDDFYVKPIEIHDLEKVLKRWLHN